MVEKSVLSCKFCGKEFDEIPALKTHEEDFHSKKKSYSCNHCDKKFAERGSFKIHERIHSGYSAQYDNKCNIINMVSVKTPISINVLTIFFGVRMVVCVAKDLKYLSNLFVFFSVSFSKIQATY